MGIFKNRNRITSQQFAVGLWKVCKDLYLDWEGQFYEKDGPISEELPPKSEDRFTPVAREVFIINLWIITSILQEMGYKRKVLDQLHLCYLDFFSQTMSPETRKQYADHMQDLFKERYEQYFDLSSKISSSPSTGLERLSNTMMVNILGVELCHDAFLTYHMALYFTYAHKIALEVISNVDKNAEIIDK